MFFGDGSGIGLEINQLTQIKFYSDAGTTVLPYAPGFSSFTGGFGEVVPVPEPSSVIAGLALCGLAAWRERRVSGFRRGQRCPARALKAAAAPLSRFGGGISTSRKVVPDYLIQQTG